MNGIDSDGKQFSCGRAPSLGTTLCEHAAGPHGCNQPAGFLATTLDHKNGTVLGKRLCAADALAWCAVHNLPAPAPGFMLVYTTAGGACADLIDQVAVHLAETIAAAGDEGRQAWESIAEEITGGTWLAFAVSQVAAWPRRDGGLGAVNISPEMLDHLIGEVSAARWRQSI